MMNCRKIFYDYQLLWLLTIPNITLYLHCLATLSYVLLPVWFWGLPDWGKEGMTKGQSKYMYRKAEIKWALCSDGDAPVTRNLAPFYVPLRKKEYLLSTAEWGCDQLSDLSRTSLKGSSFKLQSSGGSSRSWYLLYTLFLAKVQPFIATGIETEEGVCITLSLTQGRLGHSHRLRHWNALYGYAMLISIIHIHSGLHQLMFLNIILMQIKYFQTLQFRQFSVVGIYCFCVQDKKKT